MGHVVNKGPSDPVSIQHIHNTSDDRKRDLKEFKERKAHESKIKDERFAKFAKRGKHGGGKGINLDVLKD